MNQSAPFFSGLAFRAALAGLEALLAHGIRAQMEVVLSQQNSHQALDFVKLGESAGQIQFCYEETAHNPRQMPKVFDASTRFVMVSNIIAIHLPFSQSLFTISSLVIKSIG